MGDRNTETDRETQTEKGRQRDLERLKHRGRQKETEIGVGLTTARKDPEYLRYPESISWQRADGSPTEGRAGGKAYAYGRNVPTCQI